MEEEMMQITLEIPRSQFEMINAFLAQASQAVQAAAEEANVASGAQKADTEEAQAAGVPSKETQVQELMQQMRG